MNNPAWDTQRFWTLPNSLTIFRLVGSLALLPVAWMGWLAWYIALAIALIASDWLDGKLAILLRQRSVFGARLDSFADVTMYAAFLTSLLWLKGAELWAEWPWLATAITSYLVSSAIGWWKFRRWPTYHTRLAKTCWFLTSLAVFAVLLNWSLWFVRLAMATVTLANVETLAITLVLRRWAVDIPSLYHAWRSEQSASASECRS